MKANIHTVDQPDSDITAFFLSCDRLDLLDIAFHTFQNTAGEPVKRVIYDDSANPDVFPFLVKKYGDRSDIICFPENRGQWIAYDFLSSWCYTKYIFYVEDDWVFTDSGYLQLSRQILESDRTIGGVDLSEPICQELGCVGEETELFYWKKPWRISDRHLTWFSWMGSPNLRRREDYIRLGRIEALSPEWVIDRKFHLMGLKGVWTKRSYVKHYGYGRSKMAAKRLPNESITPCQQCPLDSVCKLPRTNWYFIEQPKHLKFLHSGKLGDLLFALPVIKKIGNAEIFFNLTEGSLSKEWHYDFCKPLLEKQSYIHGIHKIKLRDEISNGSGEKMLCRQDPENPDFLILDNAWYWWTRGVWHWIYKYAYTFGVTVNPEEPILEGIEIKDIPWEDRPVVSHFTDRYRTQDDNLYKHVLEQPNVIRIGDREGERLCLDMLEMATLIANSKFFIGSQSSGNALAQNLQHPRLIEVDYEYGDAYPIGPYGFKVSDINADIENITEVSKRHWSTLLTSQST